MRKKTVLVTVGIGFTGFHLLEALVQKNYRARIDDLLTRKLENLNNGT